MTPRPYIIVTGVFRETGEQFKLWYDNARRFASPRDIYVIAMDCTPIPYGDCQWIRVGDLGHNSHNGGVPASQLLCGNPAVFITGAILAYQCRCDYVAKEIDCLAFGDWVGRLYADGSNHQAVFGGVNTSGNSVGGEATGLHAQSVFLVKWEFCPAFIRLYLAKNISDQVYLPEHKFADIMRENPGHITATGMGYDRSRPLNMKDSAFYAQQLSPAELGALSAEGLL